MAFEFFTPGLSRVLAAAGAEYVIFDTEHSGCGIETVKRQISYARGVGIIPMVRVAGCAYHLVAPVLDAGAMGIRYPSLRLRSRRVSLHRGVVIGQKGKEALPSVSHTMTMLVGISSKS